MPCCGNPGSLHPEPSGTGEMVLNDTGFSKTGLVVDVFLRLFRKVAASYPRGGCTSVTMSKRALVCTFCSVLRVVWLKTTTQISVIIILMMTMIILHMAALRVNDTVSFVCQHLAGCLTSAEYNLNCAMNISPFHSPQGACLPKCLKKLPSPWRPRGKLQKTCHLDWGQQQLRVTAAEPEQISGSWNRCKGRKGATTHTHSISSCTSRQNL